MSLDALKQIVLPPLNPVETSGDWAEVEEKLGLKLPQDYKDFIEVYGSGQIGGFTWIHNPFSASKGLNLILRSQNTLSQIQVVNELMPETNDYPFSYFPEDNGLFPFGSTDNGDDLFWKTEGEPDRWTIVVIHFRGSKYDDFPLTLTTYLTKLIKREIRSKLFPDDFFDEQHPFITVNEHYGLD